MPLQRAHDSGSGLLTGPTTKCIYLTLWIDLKYGNLFITSIVVHSAIQVLITPDNNLDIFLMTMLFEQLFGRSMTVTVGPLLLKYIVHEIDAPVAGRVLTQSAGPRRLRGAL